MRTGDEYRARTFTVRKWDEVYVVRLKLVAVVRQIDGSLVASEVLKLYDGSRLCGVRQPELLREISHLLSGYVDESALLPVLIPIALAVEPQLAAH
jgi:hypothetical protein